MMLKSIRDHRVGGLEIERVCVPCVVVILYGVEVVIGKVKRDMLRTDTLPWLDLVAIDKH